MRDPIAIVEPASDVKQIAREILAAHIALQDCDRALEAVESRAAGLREQQAQRRLELGRLLIAAKRGIKHGGWEPYLSKLGITSQRASEWMRIAEFAESPASVNGGDPPSMLCRLRQDRRHQRNVRRILLARGPRPRRQLLVSVGDMRERPSHTLLRSALVSRLRLARKVQLLQRGHAG